MFIIHINCVQYFSNRSQVDLISALRVIQTIYDKNTQTSVMLNDIRYLLTHMVYGGCVDDEQDLQIVQAMIDNCIVSWIDSKVSTTINCQNTWICMCRK